MNWAMIIVHIESVLAAYLLGGPVVAGITLILWSVFDLWKMS